MWLINTHTLSLEEHFFDNVRGKYAILSHTWGDDEVSFREMVSSKLTVRTKLGWQKIVGTCREAKNTGLKYAWVDTCCIDKSSSAELSEAINSMYKFYGQSACCYVYLSDVKGSRDGTYHPASHAYKEEAPPARLSGKPLAEFKASRWFKRGWTLQELIAPMRRRFYDREWTLLDQTRHLRDVMGLAKAVDSYKELTRLFDIIEDITSVPASVLAHKDDASSYSVAQRMSWASHRSTSRMEDQAYCLLGLFDVSIPLLYGEGDRAFRRLQEEIVKETYDHSVFAWSEAYHSVSAWNETLSNETLEVEHTGASSLFALSPRNFAGCGNFIRWTAENGAPSYRLTNRGLEISLFFPRSRLDPAQANRRIAILQCRPEDDFLKALAISLSEPGIDGVQTVMDRRDSPLDHCMRVSLRPEDMAGPFPTTIASTAPRPPSSSRTQDRRGRRLIIDKAMFEQICFVKLEPSRHWNHQTLVMTPRKLFAATDENLVGWSEDCLCTAKICFRCRNAYYIACIEYDYLGRDYVNAPRASLTCAGPAFRYVDENALNFAKPVEDDGHLNKTDGTDVFCKIEPSERLGCKVMVLTIGLVRDPTDADGVTALQNEQDEEEGDVYSVHFSSDSDLDMEA